jgi:hypothetical protein
MAMGEPAGLDDELPLVTQRDFSLDELVALAGFFDLETFPGVDASPLGDTRDAAVETAVRDLVARGTLTYDDDGELSLRSSETVMLTLALAPALVLEVTHAFYDEVTQTRFAVRPELALEQRRREDANAIWTLELFPAEDLFERLVEFTSLYERPLSRSAAFSTSPETFDEDLQRVVGEVVSSSRVVAVWREGESEDELRSFQVAWVDGGDDGLWQVSDEREAFPVTGRKLLDRLLEQLPGD